MKLKTILTIFILALGINFADAQVNAKSFMKEAAETITSSKSIVASFKIESAGQSPIVGDIAVKGDKFAVTTTANSTIYNGTTQWTISAVDKEISIFEPTDEEIAQVNPFSVIKGYEKNYNIKLVAANNVMVKIQLTPKQKDSTIKTITITFGAKTKLPQQMSLTLDDNTILNVEINDIKTNSTIKESRFDVAAKDYHGYEIIDLR